VGKHSSVIKFIGGRVGINWDTLQKDMNEKRHGFGIMDISKNEMMPAGGKLKFRSSDHQTLSLDKSSRVVPRGTSIISRIRGGSWGETQDVKKGSFNHEKGIRMRMEKGDR